MLNYIRNEEQCRSRVLLAYFGETKAHDCGQCDVCLGNRNETSTPEAEKNASQQILQLLADGKRHHITEIHRLRLQREVVHKVLDYLMKEEIVCQEDGFIALP